jgi:hypothetical protein
MKKYLPRVFKATGGGFFIFEWTLDARNFVAIEILRVDEVHEWDFLIATKMSANLDKIIKKITITNVTMSNLKSEV